MTTAAASPAFSGHLFGSRGYRRIRIAMFLAAVSTFAQLYGIQPLMPTFGAEFGVDPATSALTMSLPAVGLGLAMLLVGPLSQVWGRTPLIHVSLISSAVIGLLAAAAPNWTALIVARTAQGVSLAGLSAVSMAYLSEEVHSASLARAAGVYVGGTALGGMSGRLLAGWLTQHYGWRAAIVGLSLLALAGALAVRVVLPPSRGFRPSPAQPAALARSARDLFRDPALVALFAIGCTSMGTFVGLFNAVVYRLESPPYSLPVSLVGLVFLVHIVGSASSNFAGRQAARHGYRAVAPIAALCLLASVLLTAAQPLVLILLGLAGVSGSFFGVHGVAAPWVAARASRGVGATGQATSGYLFFFYAGSAIFGALAPAAWAVGGWVWAMGLCAVLAGLTIALTLWLRRIPALEQPDPNVPPVPG